MIIPVTIHNIYKFGQSLGVINGCGQKGGFSFSDVIHKLEELPNFIPDKGSQCFSEIEFGCGVHDIICEFGGTRTMKLFGDLWFTMHVLDRVSWVPWYYRYSLCFGLFIGLHFKGKSAGNFQK